MKNAVSASPPLPTADLLARASDRRRHQRVKVALLGRFMLEDRREFPCQTIDMSPGGVALFAPVKAPIGSRIIAYIDEIGRLEGTTVRHLDNGFALALNVTALKREKLADQLTWFANRKALGMPEDRRHERIAPRHIRSTLILDSGQEYLVKLVDISRSGALVNTEARPGVGAIVTIGRTRGRVVRQLDTGVAIEFSRPFMAEQFDENTRL